MHVSAQDLLDLLVARGLTVATAESLTGGLLCSDLVSVPGASRSVLGGVVSYATAVKVRVLGVPQELVDAHGVVSAECAAAMADGVRFHLGADVGIATTGVAGPDQQDGQPVGTVYIAIASAADVTVRRLSLSGTRQQVREQAGAQAISAAAAHLTSTDSVGGRVGNKPPSGSVDPTKHEE